MEVVMNWMKSLCPISDETIRELEACLTPCHFPKRHLLVREGVFCKPINYPSTRMRIIASDKPTKKVGRVSATCPLP